MDLRDAPVIGEIVSLPDGLDDPFWQGLAEGVVRIQRCPRCERWIWGPRWVCPECHRVEPEWVDVEPSGRIFSWTRTWQKFAPEFADHVPYITVLVELPDAGERRLLGLLLGDDKDDPHIGQEVHGVIQPPSALTSHSAVLRWERVAP